jgi:FKBP-type peptidyl-prolyl cis-trans isomerase FkpA
MRATICRARDVIEWTIAAVALAASSALGCATSREAVPAGDLAYEKALEEAVESERFLEQEATAPGAVRFESGLVYRSLAAGTGASPKATDTVTVRYSTTLRDGRNVGGAEEPGPAETLSLPHLIPCWRAALPRMRVGGKSRLVCPPSLAYDEAGSPPWIGPNAALVFEVELLDVGRPLPTAGH